MLFDKNSKKKLDQFLTLDLDQFLTLETPNLGPVFNSTTFIFIDRLSRPQTFSTLCPDLSESWRDSCLFRHLSQISGPKLSGAPNPWYFLKSIVSTNGRRTAVQMGGALRYKWEAHCGTNARRIAVPFFQGLEASEAQR